MAVFSSEVVAAVLHHMNDDHSADNLLITRAFSGAEVEAAEMVGLDEHGGDWRYTADGAEHTLRVPWPGGEIAERPEIRREVVRLYEQACERLGVEQRPH